MLMFLDMETRSRADLKKVGAYVYAEDKSTDFLCVSVAFGDDKPETFVNPKLLFPDVVVMEQAQLLARIIAHIKNGEPVVAHNAQFDRVVWNNVMKDCPEILIHQTFCTAAMAGAMGMPLSLDQACKTMGVEHLKSAKGTRLINSLSKPNKKTGRFNNSISDIREMIEYCERDVEATRDLYNACFPLSVAEKGVYNLDQRLNDRGFRADRQLLKAMKKASEAAMIRINRRILDLSEGEVKGVTDVHGLRRYLDLDSVAKGVLEEEEKKAELVGEHRRAAVIRCRLDAGKTSVKKIDSLLDYSKHNNRIRGTLRYHGAATGRWSGRGPQPQNMPRGTVKNVTDFIPNVLLGGNPSNVPTLSLISSLLRSTIVSAPHHVLVGCDFSQIEARILAWIAGQEDVLEVFANGEDVYKYAASKLFNVPVSEVDADQRFRGKVTVLACGYQVGAQTFRQQMKAMYGVTLGETESERLVWGYRNSNNKIVNYWDLINETMLDAVRYGEAELGSIRAKMLNGHLRVRLPSGRYLTYAFAEITEEVAPWGDSVEGVSYTGRPRGAFKHGRIRMYGGRWTENVVQAMARDVMVEALHTLESKGYKPVLTVHDEVLCEVHESKAFNVGEKVREIMINRPAWALHLPIDAEAWVGVRYKK